MDVIEQECRVTFRYPVHFTTGVFDPSNLLLKTVLVPAAATPAKVLFVVDRGVCAAHQGLVESIEGYCQHHRELFDLTGPVLVVPGGEPVKNEPQHLHDVQRAIHDAGLCRQSYVTAVGGGAVLDVVGYAAATAHRGVRLVRVPTTILAQHDSGVGVKNGINAFGKKNYLGTFAPPFAVINDFGFLSTLSDRDWRGGISEAVKVALIKDANFFDFLEQQAGRLAGRDGPVMEQVIRRCAALHLSHIATAGDPFEQGSSRPLDFGHWAAHKLEQLTEYRLGHGEAVAMGVALDSTYSYLAGFLNEPAWRRIIALLHALGLPVHAAELGHRLDAPEDPSCVLRGLEEFREHLGGRLTITLLRSIGEPFDAHEIQAPLVVDAIELLEKLDAAHRAATPRGLEADCLSTRGSS
ncbi:MAG: 3-dehydroquinate synthase [Luteitalea sp.]|nr:3-dehydroquinate synthase [Luteitalea sp.]